MKGLADESDSKAGELFWLNIDKITIETGYNLRSVSDIRANVNDLKESIRAKGFLPQSPLTVFRTPQGVFHLEQGECRLTAMRELIAEGCDIKPVVAVISQTKNTPTEQRIVNQFIGNSGRRLDALGEAEGCRRLSVYNWNTAQIAERIGRSRAHVEGRLSLLELSHESRQLIAENRVSATRALDIARRVHAGELTPDGEKLLMQNLLEASEPAKSGDSPRVKGKGKTTPRNNGRILSAAQYCAKANVFVAQELMNDDTTKKEAEIIKRMFNYVFGEIDETYK